MLEFARRYKGLVFTTTMPTRNAPNNAMGYCKTLGIINATRSPRTSPDVLQPRRRIGRG